MELREVITISLWLFLLIINRWLFLSNSYFLLFIEIYFNFLLLFLILDMIIFFLFQSWFDISILAYLFISFGGSFLSIKFKSFFACCFVWLNVYLKIFFFKFDVKIFFLWFQDKELTPFLSLRFFLVVSLF